MISVPFTVKIVPTDSLGWRFLPAYTRDWTRYCANCEEFQSLANTWLKSHKRASQWESNNIANKLVCTELDLAISHVLAGGWYSVITSQWRNTLNRAISDCYWVARATSVERRKFVGVSDVTLSFRWRRDVIRYVIGRCWSWSVGANDEHLSSATCWRQPRSSLCSKMHIFDSIFRIVNDC